MVKVGDLSGTKNYRAACTSEVPVLITGETGTGKSTLAREIHDRSVRANKTFMKINLATLHEGTLESELFGHERGSFTGAEFKRVGKLEIANGGTVFLDEIAELSPKLQGKLLDFLQNKTIVPVGSNRELKLDVRVICATHRDLEEAVKEKTFREDLFHRIRMIDLRLKNVRELSENFGEIVQDMISELSNERKKPILRISSRFAHYLESYGWPGNFRELRNLLEYTIIIDDDRVLDVDDLPTWFLVKYEQQAQAFPQLSDELGVAQVPLSSSFHETIARFEKIYLIKALERNKGRVNQTARSIGLSKATLIRRMREFSLKSNVI